MEGTLIQPDHAEAHAKPRHHPETDALVGSAAISACVLWTASTTPLDQAATVISLAWLGLWVLVVKPVWVRSTAEAYSERLLEAAVSLARPRPVGQRTLPRGCEGRKRDRCVHALRAPELRRAAPSAEACAGGTRGEWPASSSASTCSAWRPVSDGSLRSQRIRRKWYASGTPGRSPANLLTGWYAR